MRLIQRIIGIDYPVSDVVRRYPQLLDAPSILDVGSGGRQRTPHALHLDIARFRGVNVQGDVHHLPFRDESFDAIWLESVLEHVPRPWLLGPELCRVLRPGGLVLVQMPWMFPLHGAPSDYQRLSQDGFETVWSELEPVESGVWHGPTVAVLNALAEYLAIFSFTDSPRVRLGIKGVVLAVFWWVKYLDKLLVKSPGARRLAASLYYLARRRPTD